MTTIYNLNLKKRKIQISIWLAFYMTWPVQGSNSRSIALETRTDTVVCVSYVKIISSTTLYIASYCNLW